MTVSKTVLMGVLTIGSLGLAATDAAACHGGSRYGGYGYSSNYYPRYTERVYVQEQPSVSVTTLPFSPTHSIVVVMPGDSWPAICAREYGNPALWGQVLAFNGIPQNVQLTAGMQLRLPVINPNGSFSLSSAPAMVAPPQGIAGGMPGGVAQGMPQGMPQGFAQGMPQSQGMPQGMPTGFPQGGQPGPQAGMPSMNGGVQQLQGFDPQQGPMGMAQGAPTNPQTPPLGQQMQQLPPQGPAGPQGPEAGPSSTGSIAQRIADELTGFPGLGGGQSATPNAGPTDRPLPSIVIGSVMTINGQQLGDNRGTVRLVVNGSPVALEIVEWTPSSAKVRIPGDLPAGLQVQIEILRADGSVVAKDAVQLAAGQKVAAANPVAPLN